MGNILDIFTEPKEDEADVKKKLAKWLVVNDQKLSSCPEGDVTPAVDYMYSQKTRIIKTDEKCPKGTSEYHRKEDLIECSAGGVNDEAAKAKRDAAFAGIKKCLADKGTGTTSTYAPEPYEKTSVVPVRGWGP